jgi:hypothetical protein
VDLAGAFVADQAIATATQDYLGHAVRAGKRAFLDLNGFSSSYSLNEGNPWLIQSSPGSRPTVALIDGTIGRGHISNVDAAIDGAKTQGIPFSTYATYQSTVQYQDSKCVFRYAASDIGKEQLAMFRGAGAGEPGCQKSTGASPWVGVSITDVTAGGTALVAIDGTQYISCGSNTIAGGDAVKADATVGHNGQVVAAAPGDANIVGWSLVGNESTHVLVHIDRGLTI